MGADGRPVIVVDDEELVADTIALIFRSRLRCMTQRARSRNLKLSNLQLSSATSRCRE
jgi:hypothetical protein